MAYDPLREMEQLRRAIDQSFEQYSGARWPRRWRGAFLPGSAARQYPLVNLAEDKENFYVEALAPGVDPASLEISIDGQVLTISGEKKGPEGVAAESFHRSERQAGKFTRRVDLTGTVDVANVKADYQEGLLEITLPKAPETKPRQIQISAH
ncbi:MAG: Hsp20/alpha crystallin family protein [Chloroflexota bacterium]